VAELTNIRYYPDWTSLYTTYLTAKLKVGYNKTKKRYILRRLPITVGSKVYLELPSTTVIGTILDINKTNFNDKYKEKIIYLVNTGGWSKDAPYRYDNIKVGDKLFDGESVVFEVLDKKLQKNIWAVTNNFDAQIYEREVETTQNIIVKAKMKVKEINNTLIFGEEYRIYPNASPPLVTDNFSYDGFTIRKIE
jgi:hypothetical protein